MNTHIRISVIVDGAESRQEFDVKQIPSDKTSPTADKAVRAAALALGVKIPKLNVPK